MSPPRLLLLDGSLRPGTGNTAAVLAEAAARWAPSPSTTLALAGPLGTVDDVVAAVQDADALLIGTGTYWHGWGSPLQRFLEVLTPWEGTPVFAGKPVACVITADAYGGLDLAARLLHTCSSLGCLVPPCSTLVLTRTAQRVASPSEDDADLWTLADLDPLLHNLRLAATTPVPWSTWPVRGLTPPTGAWPASGPLDLGVLRFAEDG